MRNPIRFFAFCRLAVLLIVLTPQASWGEPVVFLGDSMLYGFDNYPDLRPKELVNLGASSTLSSYVASRAGEAASLKPGSIFIATGINDISSNKDQAFLAANIDSALGTIEAGSSATRIYVHATLPVNFAYFPSPSRRTT
ncbi:hypothetical protein NNJEOMEG_02979 [Fundidesulfovibrio magnetotacticus]|uniref:SGNH hydrolase-type esterase domain-containing protein n=1 Tax=Fundidesulfovibrio magnetotacticus TaxID=2730080 RepID=A0A6V8LX09_9BACT|nr:GDSL-type esterase/lipase family protein [Fundidesulfovibrio magnetotacticus]GFK95121.1 hypothetical protein NNJEOMEG_02979 [Fundidesulfovibrio magnetotacticus]